MSLGKSIIDDVEKDWGKPDEVSRVIPGTYATYTKKNAVFGYNKDSPNL